MISFELPNGYTLYNPDAIVEAQGIDIPGQQLYGGATITRARDANGVLHVGCNARGPDGDFRYRVFRFFEATAYDIPLQDRASGRGTISIDQFTGEMVWIAWEFSQFFTDVVPGTAPFTFGGEPGPAGSGGRNAAPGGMLLSPTYNGQLMSGGQWIDMVAAFGVPAGCAAYDLRFVVQADRPNVRARLGTGTAPAILTINTQVAGMQTHGAGSVNAATDGQLWLSIVDATGAPASANIWIQVKGWWTR